MFTASPAEQVYVQTDPLALRKVTLRFAAADARLTHQARRAAPSLTMPTLLTLAGRDQIVDNSAMRDYLHQVPCTETTMLEYPTATHTLDFEDDPTPYFCDLAEWVQRAVR